MTPCEYLDRAKEVMKIESDNALAKRLDSSRQNISSYRLGTASIPPDIAFRLAIALSLDPATVLADLESQQEKNVKRREFWRSFLLRAAKVVAVLILAWSFTASSGNVHGTRGGFETVAICALALLWRTRMVRII